MPNIHKHTAHWGEPWWQGSVNKHSIQAQYTFLAHESLVHALHSKHACDFIKISAYFFLQSIFQNK